MTQFTDRYKALGMSYPDVNTVCKGPCEGTGVYPLFISVRPPKENEVRVHQDYLPSELKAWLKCHKRCVFYRRVLDRLKHMEWWYWKSVFESCDGWHFIRCSDCNGTGRRP